MQTARDATLEGDHFCTGCFAPSALEIEGPFAKSAVGSSSDPRHCQSKDISKGIGYGAGCQLMQIGEFSQLSSSQTISQNAGEPFSYILRLSLYESISSELTSKLTQHIFVFNQDLHMGDIKPSALSLSELCSSWVREKRQETILWMQVE